MRKTSSSRGAVGVEGVGDTARMGWAMGAVTAVCLLVVVAVRVLLRRSRFPLGHLAMGGLRMAVEWATELAGMTRLPCTARALRPYLHDKLGGQWTVAPVSSGGQMGGYWKAKNVTGDAVFVKVRRRVDLPA